MIHEACLAAQVHRLIHLSSAVVYGGVSLPDIDDDSPPLARHWMPYARAKADSEVWLRNRIHTGALETAVLRPGIVWGARSPHTINMARSLLRKNAFLVSEGEGVFNGIYIDNLVACIRACCDYPDSITGFYNVADLERLTWRQFYSALGRWLDVDIAQLPHVSGDRVSWSKCALIDYIQGLPIMNGIYHRLKSRVPHGFKSAVKSYLDGSYEYETIARQYEQAPSVDRETWHLQRVKHKLPTAKFARHFEYVPPVSFDEGIRRTVRWLSFSGLHQACAECGSAGITFGANMQMARRINILHLRSCRGVGGGPEKTILFGPNRSTVNRFRSTLPT